MTSEVLQQLDLSQRPLGQNLLAKHIGNLLDGDALTRLRVGSGTGYRVMLSACWFPRGSAEKTKKKKKKQPQGSPRIDNSDHHYRNRKSGL